MKYKNSIFFSTCFYFLFEKKICVVKKIKFQNSLKNSDYKGMRMKREYVKRNKKKRVLLKRNKKVNFMIMIPHSQEVYTLLYSVFFFLHFIRLHMFRTKCSFCSFSLSRHLSYSLPSSSYLCFSLLSYMCI